MRSLHHGTLYSLGLFFWLCCLGSAGAVTQQGDPGKVRFLFRQGTSFDSYIDNATTQQKQDMNQDFWQAEEFHPHFDPMTSWYPKALAYMDSIAIYTDDNPNMNWVIKDINGQPLFINYDCTVSQNTCTQYAADITNTSSSGFRAWWISQAQQIPSFGYYGLWVDDVNLYKDSTPINLVHGDGTKGIPVDPNTGQEMTADQWNAYMAAWMTQIRTSMPASAEILQNSLWYAGNGTQGTDPNVRAQISQADLINIEGGICDAGLTGGTGYYSLSSWFNYIDQVHGLGKGVVLDNESSCASDEEEYTLAGYYMISNGTDAMSFYGAVPGASTWWPGFNVSLGAPSGTRYHRNGSTTLWERDYANGMVLLNEPGAATVTVTLPHNYSRIDGSTVTSVTLPAMQGAVLMNIVTAPAIALTPTTLSATGVSGSANPASQTLTLKNSGTTGTTLAWSATSNASWLTLSSLSGSLAAGSSAALTVSFNTSGQSIGTHTGTLTFICAGASNSPQTVAVTLTVNAPSSVIALSPTTVNVSGVSGGSNPAAQTVTLRNSGATGSTLNWSATSNASWLVLSSNNGTLASGASAALSLSVNNTGLSVGSHTGVLTFTGLSASNNSQTVTVTFNVTAPVPAMSLTPNTLSASSVSGGANPASQTLTLTNSGGSGSTLAWTAASNASWLTLSSASGSLGSGSSTPLTVAFNATGLSVGSHSGALTFTSSGASNSPQTVAVTLNVTATPKATISLTPNVLAATGVAGAASPGAQTVILRNSGASGSMLAWTATPNASWLNVAPRSGSLGAGLLATLSITFNTAGLVANTYTGTISIADPNSTNNPQLINVTLTLAAPASTIAFSPTSLSFVGTVGGASPAAQTFSMSNSGPSGSTLNWSVASNQTWLGFTPGTGSLATGGNSNVTVSVNTAGLTAGVHTATLTLTGPGASNSPQTLSVGLTMNPASIPVLSVSPAALTYAGSVGGTSSLVKTLTISNVGTGTLNWTASDAGLSWVHLSSSGGSLATGASTSENVTVDLIGLGAGSYNDTISVSGGSGSVQQIPVTITITAAGTAVLSVNNQTLSFTAPTSAQPVTQIINLTNSGSAGTTLNWSATSDSFWLTVVPAQGALTSNESVALSVTVTPASLATAVYDGAITVSDPNSANVSLGVGVQLNVVSNVAVGPLPDPDLSSLQANIPTNGILTIANAAAYTNVTFIWSVTLATNGGQAAARSSIARASSINFKSGASASLSNAALSPGYYVVSVYAMSNQNNTVVSKTISKNITLVSDDLSSARVYPNPWRQDKHAGHLMTFDHLPLSSTVKIYTVSGHLVKRLDASMGSASWDLTADGGSPIASGLYVYLITSNPGGRTKGTISVLR